jgi:PAS domain S-box-containing protein
MTPAWLASLFPLDTEESGMSEQQPFGAATAGCPARFASILDIAEEGIIAMDRAQRIVLFNGGAERVFGWSAAEIIGERIDVLIPDRFLSTHSQDVEDFAASPVTARLMGERRPVVGKRQNGTEFPAEISICKFQERGELYFAAILRDVTERKKLEAAMVQVNHELEERVKTRTAELESTNRQLHQYLSELQNRSDELRATSQQLWQAAKLASVGELAASIAHELNNPLGTVSLRIESILAQTDPDDPRRKPLEIVEQEVERMAHLVSNLLQFSRQGKEQISTVRVDDEIRTTLELTLHHLRRRGIEIAQEYEASLPAVFADRQKLRQVFLNLLTNAGDAMPKGGRLTIRAFVTRAADTTPVVVIEVVDTGSGIPANILPRVMDPFFTTKEEGKGTGLGLAICKRVIQEHKGSIQIESAPGKGTLVRLTLPIVNLDNVRRLGED